MTESLVVKFNELEELLLEVKDFARPVVRLAERATTITDGIARTTIYFDVTAIDNVTDKLPAIYLWVGKGLWFDETSRGEAFSEAPRTRKIAVAAAKESLYELKVVIEQEVGNGVSVRAGRFMVAAEFSKSYGDTDLVDLHKAYKHYIPQTSQE